MCHLATHVGEGAKKWGRNLYADNPIKIGQKASHAAAAACGCCCGGETRE